MKVLGICGSPHTEGNTAFALKHALSVLEEEGVETAYVSLAGLDIAPCEGCYRCRYGTCIHDDDMAPILEQMRDCDGLILASPVYMGMVTGQMKLFMDRTVLFRTGGTFALSGKLGGGIACGGFRNGGQELTLQNMQTYFLQQDMHALSDGPRYSHSGAAIVGQASEDVVGLQTVANMGRRMARALQERQGG
jgi:multimeric flavodoxin WrbA